MPAAARLSWDAFKSTPPPVQIQLESTPPGADARTSLGPGCTTPCSVNIPTPEGSDFTVTYTMDKFQPATVPAHVIRVRRCSAIGQDRSQSDRRRTSAHRPAAEAGPQENAPAETQSAQGCRGPSPPRNRRSPTRRQRLLRLRRPHRLRRRPPADCLHCTTTAPQQRCRLCARSNMPTLCSRAAFTDVTAAAPKGTFE